VLAFCVGLTWQSVLGLVDGGKLVVPRVVAWVAGVALVVKEGFYRYARRQAERLGG